MTDIADKRAELERLASDWTRKAEELFGTPIDGSAPKSLLDTWRQRAAVEREAHDRLDQFLADNADELG